MARTLLVVDDLSDWDPYYPSEQIMTFEDYLAKEQGVIPNIGPNIYNSS